ncbi:questin oxygenase tpcI [Aspergillus mulundensis]|uniref:Questin oxidase n=1 Tax=Aspergillus mulundensis TaxID=1810919 RepID=A0A3D8QMI8_9EURO|nr:Questin oxidase [Aspergillus mulundensis]RDW62908.1 Questin oxidase [Aspergillus mulundensis]
MSSSINIIPTKLGQNIYAQGPSPQALSLTNRLLQENHDTLHIFFRDLNGHNHLAHNLLTRLVLGATPEQLQAAYDDDLPTQRAMPPLDPVIVDKLSDKSYFESQITKTSQYTNFLRFFEKEIFRQGSWKDAVNEYVFSRSPIAKKILPLMYDGAYHPIIHLGLGVEFEQPGVIAEALAQAAAHDSFGTDYFFLEVEKRAAEQNGEGESLVNLLQRIRHTPKLVEAGRVQGLIGTMKMKSSILINVADEIIDITSRFKVTKKNLEEKTAEMLNLCAYMAGAAQRIKDSCQPKIDFFFMHCVTSSLFFSVLIRQDWIAMQDKVRLVEWKGRLDLMWYAVCGAPDLDIEFVRGYKGEKTGDMSWEELFRVVNQQHDDGHVAKVVRALKNGEEICGRFENQDEFLVKGDMWLKIAKMAYETTIETSMQNRWVLMAGLEGAWKEFEV